MGITRIIQEFVDTANKVGLFEAVVSDHQTHVEALKNEVAFPLLFIEKTVPVSKFNLKTLQRVYHFNLKFTTKTVDIQGVDVEDLVQFFLQEFRDSYKAQGFPWKIEHEDAILMERRTGVSKANGSTVHVTIVEVKLDIRFQSETKDIASFRKIKTNQ